MRLKLPECLAALPCPEQRCQFRPCAWYMLTGRKSLQAKGSSMGCVQSPVGSRWVVGLRLMPCWCPGSRCSPFICLLDICCQLLQCLPLFPHVVYPYMFFVPSLLVFRGVMHQPVVLHSASAQNELLIASKPACPALLTDRASQDARTHHPSCRHLVPSVPCS